MLALATATTRAVISAATTSEPHCARRSFGLVRAALAQLPSGPEWGPVTDARESGLWRAVTTAAARPRGTKMAHHFHLPPTGVGGLLRCGRLPDGLFWNERVAVVISQDAISYQCCRTWREAES
jgi:hypothetical protein